MAATYGTYTMAQGSDSTPSGLYTLWKNTIAPGMGFDNDTELFYDQADSRLVYTKTNLVGTYATTYWQFYFTNNAVNFYLYDSYNTTTQTGTGQATYGSGSWSITGASHPYTIYYWKDSAANPQWGLCNVLRTSDNISVATGTYSGAMGWCKITPFNILNPNSQVTSLFISNQWSGSVQRRYHINTALQNFFGGYTTQGTTAFQGKNIQTVGFALGNAATKSTPFSQQSAPWINPGTNSASTSPVLTTPVVVGSHGLVLGYINSTDLSLAIPLEPDKYRVEDRLIVTADVEEWQPTGRYSCELFVRVV
jgi:hypothetical protein